VEGEGNEEGSGRGGKAGMGEIRKGGMRWGGRGGAVGKKGEGALLKAYHRQPASRCWYTLNFQDCIFCPLCFTFGHQVDRSDSRVRHRVLNLTQINRTVDVTRILRWQTLSMRARKKK